MKSQLADSRRTAKRSPLILVTDSRNDLIKGVRAPFAGQSFRRKHQQIQQQHMGASGHNTLYLSLSLHHNQQTQQTQQSQQQNHHYQQPRFSQQMKRRLNRYTDVSVDNILLNLLDIPLGLSRVPPILARGQMGLPRLEPRTPIRHKNIRSIPKLSSSLPSRSSKTSQKLVLIPEQQQYLRLGSPPMLFQQQQQQQQISQAQQNPIPADLQAQLQRSRAELMSKEFREQEFSRMTAYYICEQFNFAAVLEFLRENHGVKPRLYDEALYVPYSLPLLPGTDGYRVRSNNSAKMELLKKMMETMITTLEQKDYLYEYYSGVETPEDANNYLMDPEQENFDSTPFDPLEPQFFAPEEHIEPTIDQNINPDSLEKNQNKYEQSGANDTASSAGNGSKARGSGTKNINNIEKSQADIYKHHAEMFIFEYGIVVFWNFSEIHEKNILADLAFASEPSSPLLINPLNEEEIEMEAFHFEYDTQIHRPRLYNDMITLRSGDQLIKLTMSHAIAQLTKLGLFESRMINILQLIAKLPKKLALTGKLGLKRQQLLKKSGKLFKLRVDVNLQKSILDTPAFFWSLEPALHPLYSAVRDYLEIEQRVQVINDRCKVFLEFVDIVTDSMNERNTNRITWMIILIIALSLGVSLFEFILGIF